MGVTVRDSTRALLLTKQAEKPDYDLYTYLLFKRTTNDTQIDRYLAALEAYWGVILPSTPETDRSATNVVLVPVREPMSDDMDTHGTSREVAEWLLEKYDYGRAAELFGRLPRELWPANNRGPILVSSLKPLTGKAQGQLASWDLSERPPRSVGLWFKEFIRQVEREDYWVEDGFRKFMLHLKTQIEEAGEVPVLPIVRDAIGS